MIWFIRASQRLKSSVMEEKRWCLLALTQSRQTEEHAQRPSTSGHTKPIMASVISGGRRGDAVVAFARDRQIGRGQMRVETSAKDLRPRCEPMCLRDRCGVELEKQGKETAKRAHRRGRCGLGHVMESRRRVDQGT